MSMDSIIMELHGIDGRTRKLEAALRVTRGYVLRDDSEQARRDLATLDKALSREGAS